MSDESNDLDINVIVQDGHLKALFLDYVAKDFRKELFRSMHDTYHLKIQATKECYESLYLLTQELKHVIPDSLIKRMIDEVSMNYMEMVATGRRNVDNEED